MPIESVSQNGPSTERRNRWRISWKAKRLHSAYSRAPLTISAKACAGTASAMMRDGRFLLAKGSRGHAGSQLTCMVVKMGRPLAQFPGTRRGRANCTNGTRGSPCHIRGSPAGSMKGVRDNSQYLLHHRYTFAVVSLHHCQETCGGVLTGRQPSNSNFLVSTIKSPENRDQRSPRPHNTNKRRTMKRGTDGRQRTSLYLAQDRENFGDRHRRTIREEIGLVDGSWILQREDDRGNEIVDSEQ